MGAKTQLRYLPADIGGPPSWDEAVRELLDTWSSDGTALSRCRGTDTPSRHLAATLETRATRKTLRACQKMLCERSYPR